MIAAINNSGIKWQKLFFCLFLLFGFFSVSAQENPPIPIKVTVNTSKYLNFGSFTAGTSGGTVTVDHTGSRTSDGDIFLLNFGETSSAALFEVTANPGTIISITHGSMIPLKGSNGGEIYLNLNSYSTGKTFITTANPPNTNPVFIGGTLFIGNESQNPAGNYQGQIIINFIQQ